MVLLVRDWEDLREYIHRYPQCELIYKVDTVGEDEVRIRVWAGRLGIDLRMKEADPIISGILRFLDEHDAKPITEQRNDNVFFL